MDAYGVEEMVVGHHFLHSNSIEMEESMEEWEMGMVNVGHHSQNFS